jgi:DNA repair exonuclease SbcCD ATPase subunit
MPLSDPLTAANQLAAAREAERIAQLQRLMAGVQDLQRQIAELERKLAESERALQVQMALAEGLSRKLAAYDGSRVTVTYDDSRLTENGYVWVSEHSAPD